MINAMVTVGRNVQAADVLSSLSLSYAFFFPISRISRFSRILIIRASSSVEYWRMKKFAPSDRYHLTIHLDPDYNYPINIHSTSNSLVNF